MVVPIVLILGLEKTLEASALGVVIGAVIGYLLSGVSETIAAARLSETG
jgi:ABC-type microcin C transport system permease subunit YejE